MVHGSDDPEVQENSSMTGSSGATCAMGFGDSTAVCVFAEQAMGLLVAESGRPPLIYQRPSCSEPWWGRAQKSERKGGLRAIIRCAELRKA